MNLWLLLITIGAYIAGCVTVIVASGITVGIKHAIKNFRLKVKPGHDEVVNNLSVDTQVVLKQYMEQFDLWGETVYIVRDVKLFDILLQNHHFYEPYENSGCNLNQCINEHLSSGTGFVIFANGKEYVAIPPITHVNTDCLIK